MAAISLPTYTEATGIAVTRAGPKPISSSLPTSNGILSTSTVSIHLEHHTNFVFPAEPHTPCRIKGFVRLSLVSKKQLKSVTVEFKGASSIAFPRQGYITFPSHHSQEITLALPISSSSSTEVPPGTYDLPFEFLIPPTLPPIQRTRYGRNQSWIQVKAKGAGRWGGTVEARKEADVTVVPVALVDPQRDMRFDTEVQELSPVLGPYRMHLYSPLLCVSGLLYPKLFLPSPSPLTTLSIHKIRLFVTQHFHLFPPSSELSSAYSSFDEEVPPDQRVVIAEIDARRPPDKVSSPPLFRSASGEDEPEGGRKRRGDDIVGLPNGGAGEKEVLVRLEKGEPWQMEHVARLSCDDYLRGTTHPNTITPLRLSHDLHMEIVYSTPEVEGHKVLGIKKPITLASCCCHTASLFLPTYAEDDPNEYARLMGRLVRAGRCICEEEMEDLKKAQLPETIGFFEDGLMSEEAGMANGRTNGEGLPAWAGKS